jgi:hypothetical protein
MKALLRVCSDYIDYMMFLALILIASGVFIAIPPAINYELGGQLIWTGGALFTLSVITEAIFGYFF